MHAYVNMSCAAHEVNDSQEAHAFEACIPRSIQIYWDRDEEKVRDLDATDHIAFCNSSIVPFCTRTADHHTTGC